VAERVGRSKAAGFTLIELVILVAIIGILASIAVPVYLDFRKKALTVEARTGLRYIWDLEAAYYKENDVYSGDLAALGFELPGTKRYTYTVQANPTSFTAHAAANLDLDSDEDVWEIYSGSPESVHVMTD
jgi:prepilin-type N-terminal cleavage/methylation domain-containing protein